MKRAFLIALFVFLAATAAVAEPAANNAVDTAQATWADGVASVLHENCASCHRPGQVAPMSLLSYQEARPWAKSIRRVVNDRSMPPWFANPEHGDFREDARLSDDEVNLLTRWVAAGAPAGDLAAAPAAPSFNSDWKIGEPDVILSMEPFEVTDEMEDHYEWVQVTNPLDRDVWIESFEVRPSFMEAAHHNLTYIGPEGATLESIRGLGQLDLQYVGGWAPGVMPGKYEEGLRQAASREQHRVLPDALPQDPGRRLRWHRPDTGRSEVRRRPVDKQVTTMWILDPALNIPAGESAYSSRSAFEVEHDATIFNFTPHMHLRGKSMRYTAKYPDGREEILLDVPGYDFNWQLTYSPQEPLVVPAGTVITVDAVFDNSADNLANPDPSIVVTWGEETTDEMMIGFMDYNYVNQAEMPQQAVPEHMREQFNAIREARRAAEGSSGGE